ncbi:glycosyltransferase [Lactobacillus sp. ESL0703]|uniref:glycosyltransferase family 32 protein n=1 Tax=Lactobacillus sp. ESL0703 TaxID=2983218 RepID=UPI0023F97EBB|nr:glycosyltransferase [Lactobacillus sp. ESL0703]MDF7668806.1 glycosyltransferase [Lactobacillus sp. ESL0703]
MIPKVINYCWFGKAPLPSEVQRCISSWQKYCPDYAIVRWDESNFDVNKYDFTREAYEKQKWAFVSDVARLDIIYHHGGIYLDTDVELIKSLDSVLAAEAYFGCEDRLTINTGGGFGAVKGNKLIWANLNEYQKLHFINHDGTFNQMICTDITTHLLAKRGFKFNGTKQKIDNVVIYPSSYFCPVNFWQGKLTIKPNTISIHHYAASWKDEKNRNGKVLVMKKYLKHYIDFLLGYGTYNKIKRLIK